MPPAVAPDNGLELYDLSHPWGAGVPIWPGHPDVRIERATTHARQGVLAQRIQAVMHVSTHMNAPAHLVPRGAGVGQIPLERCFGNGVVVDVPKEQWGLVTADDVGSAEPPIEPGDVVVIATGWHRRYSDSREYFGLAPGLAPDAARWLVERDVKLVAVDTGSVDHPLATSLGAHRNGPMIRDLPELYERQTGRRAADDFPDWNPAHRILLEAGIPTVENVGGDVDEVRGRRAAFHAAPWEWREGDACVIRLVAIVDRSGGFRFESGAGE